MSIGHLLLAACGLDGRGSSCRIGRARRCFLSARARLCWRRRPQEPGGRQSGATASAEARCGGHRRFLRRVPPGTRATASRLRRKHACVSCGGDFPVHFGFWRWRPPHGLSHPEVFKKPQKSPAAFASKGGPRSFAASVPISSSRHLQKNQVDLFAGIVQGLKARPWLQPKTPPNSDQAKVSA